MRFETAWVHSRGIEIQDYSNGHRCTCGAMITKRFETAWVQYKIAAMATGAPVVQGLRKEIETAWVHSPAIEMYDYSNGHRCTCGPTKAFLEVEVVGVDHRWAFLKSIGSNRLPFTLYVVFNCFCVCYGVQHVLNHMRLHVKQSLHVFYHMRFQFRFQHVLNHMRLHVIQSLHVFSTCGLNLGFFVFNFFNLIFFWWFFRCCGALAILSAHRIAKHEQTQTSNC